MQISSETVNFAMGEIKNRGKLYEPCGNVITAAYRAENKEKHIHETKTPCS